MNHGNFSYIAAFNAQVHTYLDFILPVLRTTFFSGHNYRNNDKWDRYEASRIDWIITPLKEIDRAEDRTGYFPVSSALTGESPALCSLIGKGGISILSGNKNRNDFALRFYKIQKSFKLHFMTHFNIHEETQKNTTCGNFVVIPDRKKSRATLIK